ALAGRPTFERSTSGRPIVALTRCSLHLPGARGSSWPAGGHSVVFAAIGDPGRARPARLRPCARREELDRAAARALPARPVPDSHWRRAVSLPPALSHLPPAARARQLARLGRTARSRRGVLPPERRR